MVQAMDAAMAWLGAAVLRHAEVDEKLLGAIQDAGKLRQYHKNAKHDHAKVVEMLLGLAMGHRPRPWLGLFVSGPWPWP